VKEAQAIRAALEARFAECGLEMHPTKTKIVYCKDANRTGTYDQMKFTFLGYEFRPREVKNSKTGKLFMSFTAAVSQTALNAMRETIRSLKIHRRSDLSLEDIAHQANPILRGWIEYYGKFHQSALAPIFRYFNKRLVAWATRKFKRLRRRKVRAITFLDDLAKKCPKLFVHWNTGIGKTFA
jgi:RNA-directed DNA polymerase